MFVIRHMFMTTNGYTYFIIQKYHILRLDNIQASKNIFRDIVNFRDKCTVFVITKKNIYIYIYIMYIFVTNVHFYNLKIYTFCDKRTYFTI